MTAPAQPEQPLRQRIAANPPHCRPGCDFCDTDEMVDAVLAVVQPDLDAKSERIAILEAGVLDRSALLEEARDALEAAGQNGAHGDDWPAVAPAIRALAAARDARDAEIQRLRAQLAAVTALHEPYRSVYDEGDDRSCVHCNQITSSVVPWPCPTALTAAPRPTT